ncbi:MAG: S9 family peptidase [Acidobacteriota bacterium]
MHRRPVSVFLCALLLLAALAPVSGQQLTLDSIYSPDDATKVEYTKALPRLSWLEDSRYLETDGSGADRKVQLVDAATGESEAFYDAKSIAAALVELPGIGEEQAEKLAGSRLRLDPATHRRALMNVADDLFVVDLEDGSARRLTFDPEPEVGEEWSPDGRFVSFVRDYDLHVVDLASGRERALTEGGSTELHFGRLDWVYQEEIYGRGNFKGYWWSPDSTRITFLKLDESPVREFTVVDHLPTELDLEVTNYPKAGSPNPTVTLGIVPVVGGATRWVDTSQYASIEHLIVRVGWTPDGDSVVLQVQDREQRWLDLLLADAGSGATRTVIEERSEAWVNVLDEPHWLEDGSFLWRSERTGFAHLYHYELNGSLRKQLTDGEWEIRSVHGVDEEAGTVYFTSIEHSPIAPHVYSMPLGGGERTRLSRFEGSHRATFSPDMKYFLDTYSSVSRAPRLELFGADGESVRQLGDAQTEALATVEWGEVEFLQVPTEDGFLMEAMLIKPPGFDPSKKYPVFQYNYGGPAAPVVRNAWGGSRYLWHQMLAQEGYVIWMCDNRSASGKGVRYTWQAYQKLGEIELQDIEDGLDWLRRQSWVDDERFGLWGWSYGGFMASYALTNSTSFRMAIAGAPVTDWDLYDTVYTERYMRRPQNNPEGYGSTSVVENAENLSGRLLLIHGTMDDNVHLQNSVQLIYALQKAGKSFELMLYPKSRHGVRDDDLVYHLQQTMTDFVRRSL